MAFTSEEESKIRQIIDAFDNGKRLSDLPEAKGANPFDLICEVMDTDGESKQAALATLLPYLEEQCAYGIEKDFAVSSTSCTRIGNLDLHRSLPIQKRMKGCLLDDDGKVVEYLNPNSWEAHKRDGSRGQVMVEIPQHWQKNETEGTVKRVKISEYPLPGYQFIPTMYMSAYEASVQRSTSKLCSVVNNTADYRGGGNNAEWDDTYRSLLGRPATVISRANFRKYARNRKSGETGWNCLDYNVYKNVFWLYVIEYANFNCQLTYNPALTAEGFAQGGLGAGVTNLDSGKWNTFNNYMPFIPCGYTDSLGNGTGVVEFSMPAEYDANTLKVQVPRYRGIENPFGHIWGWSDGINIEIQSEADGGQSIVWVCKDPAKYNDSNYDGYEIKGNEARTGGYIKDIIFGNDADMIPSAVGGGSTTYVGDYHYTNIPASGVSLRGVLFGGFAADGAYAGFACANSYNVPSGTNAYIGSRLCFLPS